MCNYDQVRALLAQQREIKRQIETLKARHAELNEQIDYLLAGQDVTSLLGELMRAAI